MPLVIFGITGSALHAGLVATGGMVGNLGAAAVVGGWVDRHSRRAAMVTSLGIRATTWSALAVLIAFSVVDIPVFVLIAFLGGAASALFRSAEQGALKEIVSRDQFPTAMSVIQGRSAAASLAGGPLGAFMLGVSSAFPFLVNALSFVASLVGVTAIKTKLGKPESATRSGWFESIRDGHRFLWRQPAFRWILGSQAISNLGINAFNFALVLILRRNGEPYWVIGLVETCIGLSILVGSFMVPFLIRRLPVGWIMTASASTAAIVIGLAATLHANVVAVLCLICAGYLFAPASNAAAMSYLAVVTPPDYQGRVAAADEFTSGALLPLATIVGGFLVGGLAGGGALIALASIVVVAALLLLSSRAVRALPRIADAEESATR